MDKVLEKIVKDIADKYSIDPKEVERVLNSPYKMMREYIQKLELKGKYFDECGDMKTNFNMPVLFKMYLNEYKLNEINTITNNTLEEEINNQNDNYEQKT